jgi:hypothetical protein
MTRVALYSMTRDITLPEFKGGIIKRLIQA